MDRNTKLVLTASFLLILGTYLAGTILTPYAISLGASWVVVGILPGSMYAVRLFFGTPIGKFADKKGTLKVLKYSLILYPLIGLVYYLSLNIPMLFAARLLHGVASAMMLPMGMAYIGHKSPRGGEGRSMATYNLIVFASSGLGCLISTVIASRLSYRADFLFLLVLALASLAVVLMARDEGTGPEGLPETAAPPAELPPAGRLTGNTGLLALAAVTVPLAVIAGMVGFFFIEYPSSRGYSLIAAGFILAAYNFLSGFLQLPFGKLADKANKFVVIAMSGVLTAAALAVLPSAGSLGLMLVLMILVAAGSSAMLAASSALAAVLGRRAGMAGTMGFLGTVNSFGTILGCLCLGLLPDRFGLGAVFYFSGTAALAGTAAFAVLWLRYIKTAGRS